LETFAGLPGPAVVVFQDLDDPPAAATFGEILCTTYQRFGAVGLVTSGTGRDIQMVEPLRFPCFVTGTQGAHGYCHFPQLGVPVRVCGLVIRPGDLLHGDRNGLTVIPPGIAPVLERECDAFMAAEGVILDYLKGTDSPKVADFAAARKECGRQIREIGGRLSAFVSKRP
jgi:regulator of RNase E activity RraA